MSAQLITHEPNQSINQQLDYMLNIPDEWNGPGSTAISAQDIVWLRDILKQYWLADMPIPFLFPMENGGIELEWYISYSEHGLEIDFETKTGLWDFWDNKSDQEHSETLDLTLIKSWHRIQISSTGYRSAEINYSFGGPI